jgi:hypothetical protein
VPKVDATAHGGHLIDAEVRPRLEIGQTETRRHLRGASTDVGL